jgi:hypothetical protein
MDNVKQILTERKKEIDLYLNHLTSVESDADKTLFKVMKANSLLMLYNLIEAIVSNSINSIRNSIYTDQTVKFDCLKKQIKIQIIKDLKKNISPENFVKQTQKISNDIIKLSFKKENISNGNIDLDKISELSEVYGFIITGSDYKETGHGIAITDIKGKRNDLAHGTYSFSEIGKDYSLEDIQKISNQTIKYLDFITNNIETYIQQKHYKTQVV